MYAIYFQFRILTAPFHHVGFADFWLADQLNSLAVVLLDFEYMVCFYAFEVEWLGDDSKYLLLTLYVLGNSLYVFTCWVIFHAFVVVC